MLVPALQYVAQASEQKSQLDLFDVIQLALLALMIFTGFLINVTTSLGLAIFFLLISVLCLVVVTVMTAMNYLRVKKLIKGKKLRMSTYFPMKMTFRKSKLLVQMMIILWYYPLIYLLALCGFIGSDYTIACYMVGGMFGKVIFASLVVESHINMLYEYLVATAGMISLGTSPTTDNNSHVDAEISITTSRTPAASESKSHSHTHQNSDRNSDRSIRSGSTTVPSKPIAANTRSDTSSISTAIVSVTTSDATATGTPAPAMNDVESGSGHGMGCMGNDTRESNGANERKSNLLSVRPSQVLPLVLREIGGSHDDRVDEDQATGTDIGNEVVPQALFRKPGSGHAEEEISSAAGGGVTGDAGVVSCPV